MTEVLIVCGVGGAGKTTTSAVLALAHAQRGARVALLTIDPARRLADAIGLSSLGNTPVRVPVEAKGTLDALMLDRAAAWEALVRANAADPASADRLLANPYFRAVSQRLSGGHEFMANEKLYELATAGRWDLVVVDTPPARHALDFLQASDRLQRVLDPRLLGALLRPSTGIIGLAARTVADAVRRLAGDGMLDDLREFFDLVAHIAEGLRARADVVAKLVRSSSSGVVLTVSARAPQLDEIDPFLAALAAHHTRFRGFVINRVMEAEATAFTASAAPASVDADLWREAIARLDERHRYDTARATADRELAATLREHRRAPVWMVADQPGGLGDADGLVTLAASLRSTDGGDTLP